MGLFKWHIKLGEYGEHIADGYVYARSDKDAIERVKYHYSDIHYNVVIEDDWTFDDEDLRDIETCNRRHVNGVYVRWED